jgi:adenine/guanine phosphoribosyltransferase-like PRPP-binding protein
MKKWNGQFVKEELGINFVENNSIIPLESLVGMAVRKNPKRAHLLVSKVLGKHIPVSPRLIISSAEILAVMVDEVLTRSDVDLSHELLSALGVVLEDKATISTVESLLAKTHLSSAPIVIGYAETATALGAIVANKLNAYYIHSTRYPDTHAVNYGTFEESHSHATSHNVTPHDDSFLNSTAPVVLVDDEMTTGNTVMNTISALHEKAHHSEYVIASLVDLRSPEDKKRLEEFSRNIGVPISVVALSHGIVEFPDNVLAKAEKLIQNSLSTDEHLLQKNTTAVISTVEAYEIQLDHAKNGVEELSGYADIADKIIVALPDVTNQKTLILSIEEDMYFPLVVAQKLATNNDNIFFSSTTRSPVLSKNIDTYAINDKISFTVTEKENDTPMRFAYNIGEDFTNIFILVNSGEHFNELHKQDGLIEKLMNRTERIILIKQNNLPEPLVGPAFGSYKAEDTKWLLKDLSNEQLEIVTEEREEAIQTGGAHYAESLPIEYQPTEEYQELFKESLAESGQKLAKAVGVVTELILQARDNKPVLVSLARAGTPIGVLVRRYAEVVHGLDLPHYAVSIVRGKGIDYNALRYLAEHHDPKQIIFIDGWTGKGAIVKELTVAIQKYGEDTGIWFSDEVAVLADSASSVRIFGTRDDYLIPSACLNSTVSGLVSRTVLNDTLIGPNDFHGAKFYKEFAENDYSNTFIDTVAAWFPTIVEDVNAEVAEFIRTGSNEPTWAGWAAIEKISQAYGINNINLVKPGVGETTRVLLRRVPWKILIRKDQFDNLKHIRLLAEDRGTVIEVVDELPYSCVGIIKPAHFKE